MAAITTEEAARRLARVILSDVELYNRERPREGESLDQQYEEGRRLFASRVSPEMLGVFDAVLEDRKSGKASGVTTAVPSGLTNGQGAAHGPVNGQVAAAAAATSPAVDVVSAVTEPPTPAEVPPEAVAAPVAAPPVSIELPTNDFGNDEITANGSGDVKDDIHDEPTRPTLFDEAPAEHAIPERMSAAPPQQAVNLPAEPAGPPPLTKVPTPAPLLKVPTPAPASASVTRASTPPPLPKVPTPPPLPLGAAPAAMMAAAPATMMAATPLATDRAPTPVQPIAIAALPVTETAVAEVTATPPSGPVPTLKVGISIPKIVLVLAIAAGLVAVIAHFARLSP